MTTYAGRPVFPTTFPDQWGNARRGVEIAVYELGTDILATAYTDRTLSLEIDQAVTPLTTDASGNFWPFLNLGEYEALLDLPGATRVPFTVLPDWDEPGGVDGGVGAVGADYLSRLTPADGRNVDDVLTVNGSNIITSAKANWTSADVGKPISIGNGETLLATRTTITQFDSESQVRTAVNMTATSGEDGVGASWGTDCGPALDAVLATFASANTARLMVDGVFFLSTPVAQSFTNATYTVELLGFGNGSAFVMAGGPSATLLSITGAINVIIKDVNFVGTKWVGKDANTCINLASSIGRAVIDHCNFFGLSGGDGRAVQFSTCTGILRNCSFGGCGTGMGTTVHFLNWMGCRIEDVMMIDFAYAYGNQYSTANTTGSVGQPGNVWIHIDDPYGDPKINASSQGQVRISNLLLDEGPIRAIIVKSLSGDRIHDVEMTNVQINGGFADGGVEGTPVGTPFARGVVIEGTDRVRINQLVAAYRGVDQSPTIVPMLELIDAGVVECVGVVAAGAEPGLGGGMTTMSLITADADTVSLSLRDCVYSSLEADCPVVIQSGAVGGVVAANKLSGTVTDADFDASPPDGTLKVTGNRIAIRNAGQWIYLSAPAIEPSAPAAPVADPQNTSAVLTWVEPYNGNAIITGYVITPYIGATAQATTTVGNVQTGTVTGLVNGTTYTFKVAAINEIGTGAQSPSSNAVIPVVRPSDVSGLAIWLRADTLGLTDGDPVLSWTDSSGLGRHAVPYIIPAPPTFQTNELNGKPIVRFDGVDDVLRTATFPLPQPITTFVVAKWATATDYKAILDGYTASTGIVDLEGASIRLYAGAVATFGVASTAWRLLAVTWDSASSVGRAEGGAGTLLDPGTAAQNGLTIGSGGLGSAGNAACDIAEIAVFSRVLTTSELNQIGGSYLAAKYGLTWTEVP